MRFGLLGRQRLSGHSPHARQPFAVLAFACDPAFPEMLSRGIWAFFWSWPILRKFQTNGGGILRKFPKFGPEFCGRPTRHSVPRRKCFHNLMRKYLCAKGISCRTKRTLQG